MRKIHNPEKLDKKLLPPGYRFIYQHELGNTAEQTPCRFWAVDFWTYYTKYKPENANISYITPKTTRK